MKSRKCFEFSGEEPFFQGHFPLMPILPGVVQLQLAHLAAEEMLGRPLVLKEVRRLKFVHVAEPRDRLELQLDSADGSRVDFLIVKGETTCSSGTLVY